MQGRERDTPAVPPWFLPKQADTRSGTAWGKAYARAPVTEGEAGAPTGGFLPRWACGSGGIFGLLRLSGFHRPELAGRPGTGLLVSIDAFASCVSRVFIMPQRRAEVNFARTLVVRWRASLPSTTHVRSIRTTSRQCGFTSKLKLASAGGVAACRYRRWHATRCSGSPSTGCRRGGSRRQMSSASGQRG